ncbi:MAG: hypothetical protein GWP14_00265, partial [Actinobacteria bacterium]|nr:hypothetical protein [Actinomycetota bacterium]
QACFFHIDQFDDVTDTLTLSRDLPAVPQAGDTFRPIIGGNFRSAQECFGLAVGGQIPELEAVACTNVTGVTVTKASGLLGEGNIYVSYDVTLDELYLRRDGEQNGVGLDVSADLTDAIVFAQDAQAYFRINVIAASLPVGNTSDIFTLTCPEAVFTPDFEGYETAEGTGGKIRYRLEVLRNEDTVDTMVDLQVYSGKPTGGPTTITSSQSLTTDAGQFSVADATDWPARSFWVKNTTRTDCRYINYRSGTTFYAAAADSGLRGYTAVNWEQSDNVQVMSDVDIAVEVPTAGQFADPDGEITPPVGVSFAEHASVNDSIYIGDLATGEMIGVWRRETIVDNHRARKLIRCDTICLWS